MVNWSDVEICRKTNRNRKVLQAVWMKSAIALCLIAEICSGIHFQGPSNTTVPEGARATLYCQTSASKTVWWKYFKHDVFYANAISYEYKSSHEAEVDVSRGIYNLIIRNASSHPGLYTCVDNDGEGESRSAWLTVTPQETDAGNNTLYTVLIAVCMPLFIAAILVTFVTVLAICCNRRCKRCQDTDAATKQNEESQSLNHSSKDPIAKTGIPAEPENLSVSVPVEKDETEKYDVNKTECKSPIESGRSKASPNPPKTNTGPTVEPGLISPNNETIVSQEKQQASVEKPDETASEPEKTKVLTNERKENNTENGESMPTSKTEQGSPA